MLSNIKAKYDEFIAPDNTYKSCSTGFNNYVLIMERVKKPADIECYDFPKRGKISPGNLSESGYQYPSWTITNESRCVHDSLHAKFRATLFKVLMIINKGTSETIESITVPGLFSGGQSVQTTFTVGEIVIPNSYDCDVNNICTNGLHFFNDFDTAFFYDYNLPHDFTGTQVLYDNDGQIMTSTEYLNGIKNGLHLSYESGSHSSHHYTNGKLAGYATEDSQFSRQTGHYIDGKKYGLWTIHNKITDCIEEGNFIDGRMDGQWSEKYIEKKLLIQGNYVYGMKQGEWSTMDETGKIIQKSIYKYNRIVNNDHLTNAVTTVNKSSQGNKIAEDLISYFFCFAFSSFLVTIGSY